jgi:uncharacterized circularly permuted ATP-grasp superfamily protein
MPFNEVFSELSVRSIYQKQLAHFQERKAPARALKACRALVSGDADFLPLVRVLSDVDYEKITQGVKQRGQALQLFLADHYFGDRSYERSKLLSARQLREIQSRYEPLPAALNLRPENLQFWYAPDIVRDECGKFRVIEDNVGFIGGIGDLQALAHASKILGTNLSRRQQPKSFYRRMVAAYRREALACGGGKVILLSYPQRERSNHEDTRLAKILELFSVQAVFELKKLKARGDALYLEGKRVGFVIVNMNPEDIESHDRRSSQIEGFWKLVSAGKLGISYSPGLEFINDKKLCPIVERLVEHYLGEKCLLRSIETVNLSSSKLRERVRAQRERWVVKMSRGQSGESVWVGKFLKDRSWSALIERVSVDPDQYLAQKYCAPSEVLGHAVDLRLIAVVTSGHVDVSPQPWGRAARPGQSKTNIACGGLLAPTVIVKTS